MERVSISVQPGVSISVEPVVIIPVTSQIWVAIEAVIIIKAGAADAYAKIGAGKHTKGEKKRNQ